MKQLFRIRAKNRAKRCYELAFRGILQYADVTLVHGEVRGPNNIRIGHAWLAGDGFIYDSVDDAFYEPADYCRHFGARPLYAYNQREAARLAYETGHYGPWEDAALPAP